MMKKLFLVLVLAQVLFLASCEQEMNIPPLTHPDTSSWDNLFAGDLSDAQFPEGVWTVEDGVLTANKDECIWTTREYKNFVLDLEFKNADGTNSGVILHCSDRKNWIPNSVEVQIADDFNEKWAKADKKWQCGAIFGHLAPSASVVKEPGQWNRFTITSLDNMIYVMLNGQMITEMDMDLWTDGAKNPDGSNIPGWLHNAMKNSKRQGYVGFQGKHGDATIYLRNIKIKEIL